MPGGKTVLLAAAILAAVLVAAFAIAWWRDPYALVRAEYARQRIALGLQRHDVVIDGQRWVYVERAAARTDAPTIVMLHGYTGSKENWYRLAARLAGRYRLVIPDLPGWGESQRVAGADHGYAAQAGQVAAFIRHLSDRPVVLLGHSMGGGIAAVVAARHPGEVARVGLLNASGVRFKDNPFGSDVLAGRNPFGVHDAASLEHYLGILFFDRKARPPIPWPASRALIDHRRADGAFEQSVLDRIGRSEARFLPGELAAGIDQPAMLLWCRQDAVIDASSLELFAARIPQARKTLLEGCGHMSLMEQPDAVASAVIALIEEGRPR
jgi:pimeloyl-ACP methyl ester carboxylesterase